MNTGFALADVILGKENPSGKLPETFPVVYEDTVTARNGQFGLTGKVEYLEGINVGYRYYEKEKVLPAFPFGHGLSYTTFQVDNLEIQKINQVESANGKAPDSLWDQSFVQVKLNICNTGDIYGGETLQCYITNCNCRLEHPVKELKGFQKNFLEPGENYHVTINLPLRAFSFYDEAIHAFTWEPGMYCIQIGTSSQNIVAETVVEL
jgi:beta-glucosidase